MKTFSLIVAAALVALVQATSSQFRQLRQWGTASSSGSLRPRAELVQQRRHKGKVHRKPNPEGELINMLFSSGESNTMVWKEFEPMCAAHAEKLIKMVDMAYTDEQLETVVLNECISYKEFPHSDVFPTSFKQHDACKDFAGKLAKARDEELRSGKKKGYEKFCAGYFQHHGGELPRKARAEPKPEPKPEPKESGVSMTFVIISVVACVVIVGLAWFVLRQ